MQRGEVLYNHTALHVETERPVMVVEGVFDALALWPHAVAVLGKPSHFQVDALASAKRPVAIVLDGDAWQEGYALAMRLRLAGQRAGSVTLPPKTDPDEVDRAWLEAAVAECIGG
jgi:DNA primase